MTHDENGGAVASTAAPSNSLRQANLIVTRCDTTTLVRRTSHKRLLPPLEPCGCIRDPDHDRHHCGNEMTLARADAVIAAAEHLEAAGLLPLPDRDELHAAWRLCPEHRPTVERLARREVA